MLLQVKKQTVDLPDSGTWSLERLLAWIRDNLLKDRPELFMKDNTVRRLLLPLLLMLIPTLLILLPLPLLFLLLLFLLPQVRPGILVLVNESDWELLGELEYVVQVGEQEQK